MKKKISAVLSLGAALCLFGLSACSNGGKSTQLGAPASATPLSYLERQDEGLSRITASAESFASKFASETYKEYGDGTNFAVAPVSVYMALAIASECASGETRSEILDGLNIDYTALKSDFSKLYCSLIAEYKANSGDVEGRLNLTNSIWLNSGRGNLDAKDNCIRSLADNYYCYSYSADFTHDNHNANMALKNFIKDQTYGLIDRDFKITEENNFVLLNTLYLKDIWTTYGDDLPFTKQSYQFKCSNGQEKTQKFLQGYYSVGRAYEEESFTHFFARTLNGYKIKFILPKEGHTVQDVFTAENIAKVNALTDYNALDDENLLRYHTRCLFPEFSASFDKDVKDVLEKYFDVHAMFDMDRSDFTSVTDLPSYCTSVRHVTELKVNKKGIEGAAVTVIPMDGSSAPGEQEYEDVYVDFIVNGAFGFILTDRFGTTVFSGVVNKI